MKKSLLIAAALLLHGVLSAGGDFLKSHAEEWMKFQPKVEDCTEVSYEGLRGVYYTGWKDTKVFAWIALPEGASREHPVPGVVLVHGGGGTAYPTWAKFWKDQGYAAICMDTCGCIWDPKDGRKRHENAGAPGWGAIGQGDWKPEDQWFTHAASAVIFAHNILRSMPEVQADRIGITGVSWGGILMLDVAGLDPRFKAGISVYGCGFMEGNAPLYCEVSTMKNIPGAVEWWQNEWDPANFVGDIKFPMHFFNGSNDFFFWRPLWNRTIEHCKAPVSRSLIVRWTHSHGYCGESAPEIVAFFNEHLKGQGHVLRVGKATIRNGVISAKYSNGTPFSATLIVSNNAHDDFYTLSAKIDPKTKTISARLPKGWHTAYLAVQSEDLVESSSSLCFSGSENNK